jgi:hypothetical protein
MHCSYHGVSYHEEADVVAELERKLTAAGIGQVSVSALKTGGTVEPK